MRFFTERISCGFPSAAEGYEDPNLNLHKLLVTHPAATFFYRVEGDELKHEYIRHGAILIVDRSIMAARGKLVVVDELGQFIVKRYTGFDDVVIGAVVGMALRF